MPYKIIDERIVKLEHNTFKRGFQLTSRLFFLSSVIAGMVVIAALQIVAAQAGVRSVPPADRLSIAQSGDSGQWKGRDVTVEYRYSKDNGQIDLSGTARFAFFLPMGYSRLEDFHLGAIFVDENGKVLEEIGLATSHGSFDPVAFHRKVKLPLDAVSMAFSYQGTAIPSGVGGITSFSFYPIH